MRFRKAFIRDIPYNFVVVHCKFYEIECAAYCSRPRRVLGAIVTDKTTRRRSITTTRTVLISVVSILLRAVVKHVAPFPHGILFVVHNSQLFTFSHFTSFPGCAFLHAFYFISERNMNYVGAKCEDRRGWGS